MKIVRAQETPTHSRNAFSRASVTEGKLKCACGQLFVPGRSDAKHWSYACRQRAYRCRKYPNAKNEWYTPPWVINLVRQVMSITLDPASCAAAQKVVKATVYFTAKEDGLSRPWFGNVWLNPPYIPDVQKFLAKLLEEFDSGRVQQAIALVNAATSASWFHKLLGRFPACFVRRRIKFWRPDRGSTSPTRPQVLFYLGPNVERFVSTFAHAGIVTSSGLRY